MTSDLHKNEYEFIALKTDVVNGNGRLYSTEVIQKALEGIANQRDPLFITAGVPDSIDATPIDQVVGIAKEIWLDGKELCAKIRFVDTGLGQEFKRMMIADKSTFSIRPIGSGVIEDGQIREYQLRAFSFLPTSDASPLEQDDTQHGTDND